MLHKCIGATVTTKKILINMQKASKTHQKPILRDSWLDPLVLKTSPELFFLFFFGFLVFSTFFEFFVFSNFGVFSQEFLISVFCFFWFSQGFCVVASELTSHLKASVLFAYIWNRLSSTLPVSLSTSPYTSLSALTADRYQCGCHLHFLTCSCEDTLSFTWNS